MKGRHFVITFRIVLSALLMLVLFTLILHMDSHSLLCPCCFFECCQGVDDLLIPLTIDSFPQETPQARRESCSHLMVKWIFNFYSTAWANLPFSWGRMKSHNDTCNDIMIMIYATSLLRGIEVLRQRGTVLDFRPGAVLNLYHN